MQTLKSSSMQNCYDWNLRTSIFALVSEEVQKSLVDMAVWGKPAGRLITHPLFCLNLDLLVPSDMNFGEHAASCEAFRPLRTHRNAIKGVFLSYIDITDLMQVY